MSPAANTYTVGARAVALAGAALAGVSFLSVAETHMRRLSDALEETVALSVWDGSAPVVVHVVRVANRPLQLGVRVGLRLTEDLAQFKVFRAFGLPAPKKSDRVGKRDAEVKKIRTDGMAIVTGQGWRGIACPVFDGDVITATLGVVGMAERLPDRTDSPMALKIREAAAELSREITASLGYLRNL